MLEEVTVRERKSAKHGKTYEYRFEIAQVGGERKWCSKGGFLTKKKRKRQDWKHGKGIVCAVCPNERLTSALPTFWMTG